MGDSILRVVVEDVRKGSVLVDFRLEHQMYTDSKAAALDEADMRQPLKNQLAQKRLGKLPASLENFKFERKYGKHKYIQRFFKMPQMIYQIERPAFVVYSLF